VLTVDPFNFDIGAVDPRGSDGANDNNWWSQWVIPGSLDANTLVKQIEKPQSLTGAFLY